MLAAGRISRRENGGIGGEAVRKEVLAPASEIRETSSTRCGEFCALLPPPWRMAD